MKRFTAVGFIVLLVLFSFMACGPKAGIPVAGSAKAVDMLSLFHKEASGVMVIDINRAMLTEPISKMLADKETAPKYQEFIKETGIDLQKDVYFIAGALIGNIQDENPEGALIINAKFNKDALLAKIKEKGGELKESVYEGITIYEINEPAKSPEPVVTETAPEGQEPGAEPAPQEQPAETAPKPEKPGYGAFLDSSNIAVGTEPGIKAVIDVLKNKKENVFKNPAMADLFKQAKKDALFWAALSIPPDFSKKMSQSNPMLGSLEGVHSVLIAFDYKNKAIEAEIKALNKDEQKNKQIADFLTGLKAMGGMAGSDKPSLGELMNKIVVASGADYVSVTANIPEELLTKLGAEFKDAMPKTPETPQDPQEPQEPETE